MYSGERAAELLRIDAPAEAAAALHAADAVRLFDRRTAPWATLLRVLRIAPPLPYLYVLLTEDSTEQASTVALSVFLVLVVVVVIPGQYLLERPAGAEPRTRWGWYLVLVLALIALVVAAARWSSWLLVLAGLLAGAWVTAPSRDLWRAGPPTAWPAGSEAFATLTVLARASWVHPRRLAALTAMPEPVSRQWVAELARLGLVSYGGIWSGGSSRSGTQVSSAGRDQVARWRTHLEELAAT
ncbi:MAG: hypothetical protein ACRCSN_05485 [Dermatophilaceae bacterium]